MTPDELAILSQQCQKLYEKGQWQEACTCAEKLHDLTRQHLGKNHTYYAHSLNNLAGIYRLVGRNQEAEKILQELLSIQSEVLKEEHPEYVLRLNNQAEHYREQGRYAEAEKLFHQALKVGSKTLGKTHPHYLQCQANLAILHHARGQYSQAEKILLEVLESWCQTKGQNSFDSAPVLHNLAENYHAMGNFNKAIEIQQQALKIWRRELGETHPHIAISLQNLANYYQELENYQDAEILLKQSINVHRQVLGDSNPNLAKNLNNLGYLNHSKGNYASAESFYYQSLEITRQVSGESHRDFAVCLNSIATLYLEIGKYEAAIPLCQKMTEIFRQSLGQNHPDLASSLHNFASLYEALGRYDKAKSLHLQSLEIRRRSLPENHPDIAGSLNALGDLYRLTNNYEDAIKFFLEAGDIRHNALGEDHTDFAESLNNLAVVSGEMGKYDDAERYYTQALNIIDRVLGKNNSSYAKILGNLGGLYVEMGDNIAAELRLQWALKTARSVYGENHPEYAFKLHNLAEFYRIIGNYVAAESRLRESLKIQTQSAANHPNTAIFLNKLAKLCVATGREVEALNLMQQQVAIDNQIMGQILFVSSERQRLAYLTKIQANISDFLSLVLQYFPNSPANVGKALELVWQRKGIGAEASVTQREAILGERYAQNLELTEKFREFTTWRMQIARKTLAGLGEDETLESYQNLLTQWNERKEQLEVELAQQIPEIRLERQLRRVDLQSVAATLPKKSILIEFIRFKVYDFQAVFVEGQPEFRYLALILPAGAPENVQAIDLGKADTIDNLLAQFRASIIDRTENRDLDLGSINFSAGTNHPSGVELRKILFDPLLDAIGDCRRLFLAPDGNLALLPFEVLPLENDRCLIDEYQFSYLSTGRDLMRFKIGSGGCSTEPLVMADPDFNFSLQTKSATDAGDVSPGRQSRDLQPSRLSFRNLPGTRLEGEKIANLLGVKPLLGNQALESYLKTCRSPRILHLATHGFFLQDQTPALNRDVSIDPDRLCAQNLENPLLRSGLALAGANTWLQRGQLPLAAEDGILTAEDVTGINLVDTELVVLSACQTGLGQVQAGEGVFGLRRSFTVAGAKTLVMSLWKVSDLETQELITDFYHRLLMGQPCAEALRDAQLTMKNKHPEPFYWGAFICQGNPSIVISKSTYRNL
jgi:tetratricopeptide (TPR) repeat protein